MENICQNLKFVLCGRLIYTITCAWLPHRDGFAADKWKILWEIYMPGVGALLIERRWYGTRDIIILWFGTRTFEHSNADAWVHPKINTHLLCSACPDSLSDGQEKVKSVTYVHISQTISFLVERCTQWHFSQVKHCFFLYIFTSNLLSYRNHWYHTVRRAQIHACIGQFI